MGERPVCPHISHPSMTAQSLPRDRRERRTLLANVIQRRFDFVVLSQAIRRRHDALQRRARVWQFCRSFLPPRQTAKGVEGRNGKTGPRDTPPVKSGLDWELRVHRILFVQVTIVSSD
jgi:hypothetical protein